MDDKGDVQNVPDIAMIFEQMKLLARNMENDVTDFYKAFSNLMTACHKWHCMAEDEVLRVRSGTII